MNYDLEISMNQLGRLYVTIIIDSILLLCLSDKPETIGIVSVLLCTIDRYSICITLTLRGRAILLYPIKRNKLIEP